MKAITIQQPYASLIIAGVKPIENRPWFTKHRGALAIHAGLSLSRWEYATQDPTIIAAVEDAPIAEHVKNAMREMMAGDGRDVPRGVVLGTVDVHDCLPVEDDQVRSHPLATGPFCMMMRLPRQFKKPIRATGKQMLWNWQR